MANEARFWTNRLLEAVEEGALSAQDIVLMCVNYMSEDEVHDMCRANDLREFLDPMEEADEY